MSIQYKKYGLSPFLLLFFFYHNTTHTHDDYKNVVSKYLILAKDKLISAKNDAQKIGLVAYKNLCLFSQKAHTIAAPQVKKLAEKTTTFAKIGLKTSKAALVVAKENFIKGSATTLQQSKKWGIIVGKGCFNGSVFALNQGKKFVTVNATTLYHTLNRNKFNLMFIGSALVLGSQFENIKNTFIYYKPYGEEKLNDFLKLSYEYGNTFKNGFMNDCNDIYETSSKYATTFKDGFINDCNSIYEAGCAYSEKFKKGFVNDCNSIHAECLVIKNKCYHKLKEQIADLKELKHEYDYGVPSQAIPNIIPYEIDALEVNRETARENFKLMHAWIWKGHQWIKQKIAENFWFNSARTMFILEKQRDYFNAKTKKLNNERDYSQIGADQEWCEMVINETEKSLHNLETEFNKGNNPFYENAESKRAYLKKRNITVPDFERCTPRAIIPDTIISPNKADQQSLETAISEVKKRLNTIKITNNQQLSIFKELQGTLFDLKVELKMLSNEAFKKRTIYNVDDLRSL